MLPKNIRELRTPVGSFSISAETKNIFFSVIKNPMDIPAEVYDINNTVVGHIQTDHNYQILIDPKQLEIGKEYTFQFTAGNWEFCDSDEHSVCYITTINQWMVGVGAFDPNSQRKMDQTELYSERKGFLEIGLLQQPPVYDESGFTEYTVEPLRDLRGFRFKLFDKSFDYVRFEVAWVLMDSYPTIEYFGALGFWLC